MTPVTVTLPTLHPGQVAAFNLRDALGNKPSRRAIRCGRRWGKTDFGVVLACDGATKRQSIGWFAPEYKFIAESFSQILDVLQPVHLSHNRTEGVIRTTTGGRVDFWSLDNDRAGRSRKYHKAIIDEAAFTKPNMMDIWEKSIEPTLLDYSGSAWALSNTNGLDAANFFWRICNEDRHGFTQYHAPSWQNPHVPQHRVGETEDEYAVRRALSYKDLEAKTHPLVYAQEYKAEFVDWGGVSFFSSEKLLVDGKPVAPSEFCDAVFAVIDTAIKTGSANDGTAVSYWSFSTHSPHKLICLDWELTQIEGAFLEAWIPSVLARCEELARACHARMGSQGVYIEDAASGSLLLQQCAIKGYPAEALSSKLTSLGKDGRALNASGPVYRGEVKFSERAYNKTTVYKGVERNHMWSQVIGFRVGDKQAATRADDLLDTFTYAISASLGDVDGIA